MQSLEESYSEDSPSDDDVPIEDIPPSQSSGSRASGGTHGTDLTPSYESLVFFIVFLTVLVS